MQKLSQTASHLSSLLKIGFVLIWVLIGIMLVSTIVCMFVPADEFSAFAPDLSLGNITFSIADGYTQTQVLKVDLLLITATGILAGMYLAYVLHTLRRILAPMIDGEPFHETVSLRFKRLSWVTLIGGGILSVFSMAFDYISLNMYDLDALFLSNSIVDYTVKYHADLSFVISFLVLQLLAFIFKYGAELQQQSDETL